MLMNIAMKMPPNHHFMLNGIPVEPVSRTYQYRKIMKPMLERKRRARINKCLDELKDLMTGTLQADGENVSKLEKADILELTVRYLHRLRESNALFPRRNETINMDKFWAGFQHCAAEVSHFLSKYDQNISGELIKYIANYIPNIAAQAAVAAANVASATESATATDITSSISNAHTNIATISHQRLPHAVPKQIPLRLSKPTPVKFNSDAAAYAIPRKYHVAVNKKFLPNNIYNQNIVKAEEISSDGDSYDGDAAGVWRPW